MNGTLALWFEGRAAANIETVDPSVVPTAPSVRLHVNLWRDLDKNFNFLDVGFLLRDVDQLGRLYLYLPAPIEPRSIFDLSNALKDADTLNAVFNEVASVTRDEDDHFVIDTGKAERIIHLLKPSKDIALHEVNVPGRSRGTLIALNSRLCSRIRAAQHIADEHYVRIRIYLHGDARSLFTTEDATPGLGLTLSQDVMETTEFRLNERRSYPPEILRRASLGRVNLRSVHYFLIRRKDFQLGSQHQNFRKVRYLEPDIWKSYLGVGQPAKRAARKSTQRAEGMIIYQWREMADDDSGLDDFIAYASFRMVRPKILAYLIAILAIGGVGSAILNITLALFAKGFATMSWSSPGQGIANIYAGGVLGILAILPMGFDRVRRWWKDR